MNMSNSKHLLLGVLVLALWPAWEHGLSVVMAAEPAESAWNLQRVGTGTTSDGEVDLGAYSKMSPWPHTDGRYLYSGCYAISPLVTHLPGADRCFMTIDVESPTTPVRLATVYGFDLVNSPSPPAGHIVWSPTYPFPNLPVRAPCKVEWSDPEIAAGTKAPDCWDPGWNTHLHSVALGPDNILAVNQERYRLGTNRQDNYHGIRFYDIADVANPVYLSTWQAPTSPPNPDTGIYPDSRGAHHMNFDGRYLYFGTQYEGYIGRILVILDVEDPRNPKEAAIWWVPGQKTPEEDADRDWIQQPAFSSPIVMDDDEKWTKHVGMHYAAIDGDNAYLSYNQAGLVILDISDVSDPKLLSRVDYLIPGSDPTNPDIDACRKAAGQRNAACGNTHSAKRVPDTDLLLVSDEYFTCPYGHVRIFDISDETNPQLLSHFLTDENLACDTDEPNKAADQARFPRRGPSSHIGNAWGSDLYFMAWYGNGLRVIDISDPSNPQEAGYYHYRIDSETGEENPTFAGADTYDVVFGPEGHLYLADGTSGLRVLEYTGPGGPTR